jgi:TolB protein
MADGDRSNVIGGVSRRRFLSLGGGAFGAAMLPVPGTMGPARAQTRVTIDEANLRPRPIAIPAFMGDDPRLAQAISDVVQADLERSGLFRPLDRAAFIEQISSLDTAPRFADWRAFAGKPIST